MSHIVVDAGQAEVLAQARGLVQVRDQDGHVVGYITPAPTEDEIARARLRFGSDEPTSTTQQVLDRLRSLERP
jgi:hypothetical protein